MTLSIAAVERDTGIGKDTLRVWERRYGFPKPGRDANDERSYPMVQVERLRVIKRLMDQGHRPGRVVAQPMWVLEQLCRADASLQATQPAQGVPALQTTRAHAELPFYLGLLQSQDADGIRLALHQALSNMGLRGFVTDVVAPLNHMVGLAWARGDLAVHQEHLYTECVSTTMRQAIAAIAAIAAMAPVAQGAAPKVLLTTFPQEAHGLGLLMVESLLALQGCQCVSLGTQMPVRDIAQAAAAHKVDVVALSFSANMNANQVVDGLLELNALLPNDVALWAGGSAPVLRRRPIEGVLVLHDLDAISGAVNQYRRALTPAENKAA